jgi:hypothetical protein
LEILSAFIRYSLVERYELLEVLFDLILEQDANLLKELLRLVWVVLKGKKVKTSTLAKVVMGLREE